jgi:hypothetical protein
MAFNQQNPYAALRMQGMMGQPRSPGGMGGFNPAMRPPPSPFNPSGPMTMGKRMMTSTLPNQQPIQSPMDDNSAYDQNFFNLLQKHSQNRPQQTAYEEALRSVPDRAQYAPGIGRKIAAGLAGFGAGLHSGPGAGIEAGAYIAESPYRQAIGDYQMRLAGLERGAELEDQQIGQTLQNIGTAAQYGASNRTYRAGQYWKDIERQQKESELDIQDYTAVTGRQQADTARTTAGNQARRWDAQSANEGAVNVQTGVRDRNTAGYQSRMAGAAESNAAANAARARAAQTAAERPTGGGSPYSPDQQNDARNLALRTLLERGGYDDKIAVNRGEWGETYNVKPGFEEFVSEQMQPILEQIERRRGGRGGRGGSEQQTEISSPWEIELDEPR